MRFYDKVRLTAREIGVQRSLLTLFTVMNMLFSIILCVTMQSALSVDDIISRHIDIRYPDGETAELKNADYAQRDELLGIGFDDITVNCTGDTRSIIRNAANGIEIDKGSTHINYLPYHQLPELQFTSGTAFDKDTENEPCLLISSELSKKYSLTTADKITFEGYTKKSVPFSIYGIYSGDEPEMIVNFTAYIREIDRIGVYSGYGIYGRINRISHGVRIKKECGKIGVYYTSCAENWFASRKLIIALVWAVFFAAGALYVISQIYFETRIFENRKAFARMCGTLGMEKKHIIGIFTGVCLLCVFAALLISVPIVYFADRQGSLSTYAVLGINTFNPGKALILSAASLSVNTLLTAALMRSRNYE